MPKVNAQVISWQICFLVTVDRDWVDVVSVGIRKYTTGTGLHHQLHWFEAGDPQARQVGRVSHQSRFIFQIVTFRSLVSLGHLPQLDGLIWKNSICVSKFSKKNFTLKLKMKCFFSMNDFLSLLLGADNTQVPSSDIITSLCGYSSVSEAWKVFVYVNGGASAIWDT